MSILTFGCGLNLDPLCAWVPCEALILSYTSIGFLSVDTITRVLAVSEESPIQLVYVPSHLYHILFELLKNAMRAVVEHYPDTSDFPPIQLLVVNGQEDLTIKVSQDGGPHHQG